MGRDILSLKSYSILECVSVVIGIQEHLKCEETKTLTNIINYIESLHNLRTINNMLHQELVPVFLP